MTMPGRYCLAIDPKRSRSNNGHWINRHCQLPAGHPNAHATFDLRGKKIHAWEDYDSEGGGDSLWFGGAHPEQLNSTKREGEDATGDVQPAERPPREPRLFDL